MKRSINIDDDSDSDSDSDLEINNAMNSPKKRKADVIEAAFQRHLSEWKRKEDVHFALADRRALRNFCMTFLVATRGYDAVATFVFPAHDSEEMRELVRQCRQWRTERWMQRRERERKLRVERQRRRRQEARCSRGSHSSSSTEMASIYNSPTIVSRNGSGINSLRSSCDIAALELLELSAPEVY
jgi:hypothetical protein